jgi:protein-tyrosine phosphatase
MRRVESTELVPGLHIGSRAPIGSSIAAEGFDVLVLCAAEWQPRSVEFFGLRQLIHVPLHDHCPSPKEVDVALRAAMEIAKWVSSNHRVLVTCMAGRNRSGFVCALAMSMLFCCSPGEAAAHIRKKRRGPDGFPALANPHFNGILSALPALC